MERMTQHLARAVRWAVGAALACALVPAAHAQGCGSLLSRSIPRLQDEKPQDLCQYAGKVVVVVNTASYCGFTPQYKSLEALNARYQSRGLVVLGFPSNDFGGQEPGNNQEVAAFCESTYGVKFPMFVKSSVKGGQANPLYVELAKRAGKAPAWNFHKYVIARDGETVASYNSLVDPLGSGFVADIERLLGAR
jgi:glutathione peroxidase